MNTPGNNNTEVSIFWRLGRVMLVFGAVTAAVVLALTSGLASLPAGGKETHTTQASDRTTLVAQQAAADKQWASSACTSILDWKNQLHHDETSMSLSFGPVARVKDAIAATKNMLGELDKLGLPPGAQGARAGADLSRLRSELESGQIPGPQIVGELRNLVSVDLGLSLVETHSCRELVGSPI